MYELSEFDLYGPRRLGHTGDKVIISKANRYLVLSIVNTSGVI